MAYWYFETFQDYTDFYLLDSWVEISSQPSSSSLSSVNDEGAASDLRVHHDLRQRRRRAPRSSALSHLNILQRAPDTGAASSQEEYEESESESERVMTSSGEGIALPGHEFPTAITRSPALQSSASDSAPPESDDDDENRTAINYPINNGHCFTPQPNIFSHPPSSQQLRSATSAPVPGSYFPSARAPQRPPTQHSSSSQQSHLPQNILSPSYNATVQHDEALRASLSTLLSLGAAARGLAKPDLKRQQTSPLNALPRSNRLEPTSLRLVPESALPASSPPQFHEPTFQPTIRRISTSTSASSHHIKDHKRKAVVAGRSPSRERRASKKARRSATSEEFLVSPTLLTWVVSAGVVVFLSALSFSAGYSMGKEAGRLEAGIGIDEPLRGCAREASRSSLGLKRSLARSAVQV
ncbi:hypothetical protein EJ03DRAFT_132180 [Teratosphaeria nubilosa]|uniref:Uncharacterized protein n=1 Tax=Teratosphaeria nubilosa TaxID=161662 RepID=A0A6G1LMQ3_9PEZI|nr:hypothetical protein EJ03DRAFT_132180 [Teratosphaeria nubilosa]